MNTSEVREEASPPIQDRKERSRVWAGPGRGRVSAEAGILAPSRLWIQRVVADVFHPSGYVAVVTNRKTVKNVLERRKRRAD